MKAVSMTTALLALSGFAHAQDIAQVLSRTAVYQQVAMPRQTCTQSVTPNAPTSGGGAMVGAIAGGVIGSALGDGGSLGTMLGVIGGAVLGDKAESSNNSQPVTTCTTQTVMENRLVGYQVVYEYAGKTYNVQLPQDPGPTLAIQVTPAGMPAVTPAAPPPTTSVSPAVLYTSPAVVYTSPPVVYGPPPVYYRPWPVTTNIHMGWGWPGGGRHRHWR
ncbi:MAG: glycine zipper 2TM domain-containing protein [Limnohabitans sp.]|jgi:uncharacterized protein YcfJ